MTLTPVSENNLWGIKDSANKTFLPTIYNELSIFIIKNGSLINSFESSKIKLNRKSTVIQVEIVTEPSCDTIFLIKKGYETNLLKHALNPFNHRSGLLNIYKEFDSLEFFKLSIIKNINATENNVSIISDFVDIGKYYEEIIHIGSGFFKVKIIHVYKILNPINEDGDYAWEYRFDRHQWSIIAGNGKFVLEKAFQEVDYFVDNLCKVKRGDRWNFIDATGQVVLNEWHYHLEYPILSDGVFLAGKKTYFISICPENGSSLFKTTDFFTADELAYKDPSNESLTLLKKLNNSVLTTTELSDLFQRVVGEKYSLTLFEELTQLDLYSKSGFLKRVGIAGIIPLTENLNIAKINSDFFWHFIDEAGNRKIFRHQETTQIHSSEFLSFRFLQLRLMDNHGDFIGSNYYHEIFNFNEKGIAKVSKSFFVIDADEKTYHLDTSLNEEFFSGEISYWKDSSTYRNPFVIKYGFIDSTGKEIIECKHEEEELNAMALG